MDRNRFTFFKSYHESAKLLNKTDRLLLIDAICRVQFMECRIEDISFDSPLLKMAWAGISPIVSQSVSGFLSKTNQIHPLAKPLAKGGIKPPSQHKEKEKEKELGEGKSKQKAVYSEKFEKFWKLYPNKKGKAQAYKSWKRGNCENGIFEDILSSLEKQKNSQEWKKDNGQYIPHGSTWVSGKRWEDEITIASVGRWR